MLDQDILDISGLIHRRWSEAFIDLQKAKNETDDGEKDWAAFHSTRLANAKAVEADWRGIKSRFMAENRAVFEKILP